MNRSDSSNINPFEPPKTDESPGKRVQADLPSTLLASTRTNQIIHGALIQGLLAIIAVLWFIRGNGVNNQNSDTLLIVGAFVWMSATIASFVLPLLLFKKSTLPNSIELAEAIGTVDSSEQLPMEIRIILGRFTSDSLIAAALLEGSAMLNCILWFMVGSTIHLGFVVASLCLMVIRFPTLNKLRSYVVRCLEPG